MSKINYSILLLCTQTQWMQFGIWPPQWFRWCRNPVLKGCNPARFPVLPGRKQLSPRHFGRNSSPGRTENTVGLWPVLQGNFVRALMNSLRSLKLFYISLITNCVDIPQQSAQMNCLQYEVLFIRNSRIQFWWNSILDFFFEWQQGFKK